MTQKIIYVILIIIGSHISKIKLKQFRKEINYEKIECKWGSCRLIKYWACDKMNFLECHFYTLMNSLTYVKHMIGCVFFVLFFRGSYRSCSFYGLLLWLLYALFWSVDMLLNAVKRKERRYIWKKEWKVLLRQFIGIAMRYM